jgi:hypothetical protein
MITSYSIQGNQLKVAKGKRRGGGRADLGHNAGPNKTGGIEILAKLIKKYNVKKEMEMVHFVEFYSSVVGCYHCLSSLYGKNDLNTVLHSLMTVKRARDIESAAYPENHFAQASMVWLLEDLVTKLEADDVRITQPIKKLIKQAISNTARDTILRFSTVHVQFLKERKVECLETMERLISVLRETTPGVEDKVLFNRRLGLSLEYEMEHPRISGQRFLNLPAGHPLHFDEEFDKSNSIDKGLVWLRTLLMGENVNNTAGCTPYMMRIMSDLGVISEYPDAWNMKVRRKLLVLFHVDRWKKTNGTYGNWIVSFLTGYEPKLILACTGYSGEDHPWQPIANYIFQQANNIASPIENTYGTQIKEALKEYRDWKLSSQGNGWKKRQQKYVDRKMKEFIKARASCIWLDVDDLCSFAPVAGKRKDNPAEKRNDDPLSATGPEAKNPPDESSVSMEDAKQNQQQQQQHEASNPADESSVSMEDANQQQQQQHDPKDDTAMNENNDDLNADDATVSMEPEEGGSTDVNPKERYMSCVTYDTATTYGRSSIVFVLQVSPLW